MRGKMRGGEKEDDMKIWEGGVMREGEGRDGGRFG